MTSETLRKANDLRNRISDLDGFIRTIKSNYTLRIFNKPIEKAKKLTLCSTDYMRPYTCYEVSRETRERIVQVLEEERAELQKELDNL